METESKKEWIPRGGIGRVGGREMQEGRDMEIYVYV